jgi:hypothetical protein
VEQENEFVLMEFIYQPGLLSRVAHSHGTEECVIFLDFFDTVAVRKCSPMRVFTKVNLILTPLRMLSEQILYRSSSRHPSIEEIVKYLPTWTVKREIDKETESLVINQKLVQELMDLQKEGTKVHIVSDTYFSSSQIEKILGKLSAFKPNSITTSSGRKLSKREGLYKLVKEEITDSSHTTVIVGDDLSADGEMAINANVSFAWVINEVKAGTVSFNVSPRQLAVDSLGYLVAAFMHWIKSEAEAMELDKVLFLSRDTHILKAIWERDNSGKIEAVYLPASRKVALESGFLDRSSNSSGYLGQRTENTFEIKKNAPQVFIDFYQEFIGSSKKIAVIDLGWNGTFQDALQNAFPSREFVGLYLGVLSHNLANPTKKGFLFDSQNRNRVYEKIVKGNIDILEVLLSSTEGTLLSIHPHVRRATIDSKARAVNVLSETFGAALIDEVPLLIKSALNNLENLERLNDLSTNCPDWFIKAVSSVRHKVSPFDDIGQPLIFSNSSQLQFMDRIWWKIGNRRYGRYLAKHNLILFLIHAIGSRIVELKFLLRSISKPQNLKKIMLRLLKTFHP